MVVSRNRSLLWFLILTAVVCSTNAYAYERSTTTFTTAEKIISDASSPPVKFLDNKVTLPDNWQHEQSGFYSTVWYQITFTHTGKLNFQWAVYLPDVNMNAEVWLNGIRLGSGGSLLKPVSRYWHSPMMFTFSPSDLLHENKLTIKVAAYANEFGHLGLVTVGPVDIVAEIYKKYFF
ncbi:MAG: hypothetical protein JKX75_06175 [Gammaproteobacteria bacterium]|nr:hypothetical protein [Gammaproteobacteria bacterium]